MIKKKLNLLKDSFKKFKIDGYVIPKNDEFFSEYAETDRLKIISNFTGTAGMAIVLDKKNYLFVDGRYTIQAQKQSGKEFKIIEIHKYLPSKIIKNITLGVDPSLFTKKQLKIYFDKGIKIKFIKENLIDKIYKKRKAKINRYFSIPDKISGYTHISKIKKLNKIMKKKRCDYLFISAPENVAWLLNIRGWDNPNSPVPNCRCLVGKQGKFFLISNNSKVSKLIIEKKLKKNQIVEPQKFEKLISTLKGSTAIVDNQTCSISNRLIINSKFKILNGTDPCYILKAIKNSAEIENMKSSHIKDGVALTKFLFWIKNVNKKKITEINAKQKLEKFRRLNKDYLKPSFHTISGTGPNGALPHYIPSRESDRTIKKNDIFLCDSGGQYKYGTTDVTRTICFNNQKNYIKNIFTKVLKGHIAVVTSDLKKYNNGKKIDVRARKFLKKDGLDYAHGTGHGVGFFSNVHEGPQSITKNNTVKIEEGMIVSNEPGYYNKGKFGIRIENLIFVKKVKKKLLFENLTLAPIDKDLINTNLLTNHEKNYLFEYHLLVYSKLSKYLKLSERKWLASLI